ncbi:MAG: tRNA pseudouridine(13) synthase TruD [Candidatus Adiutrix sp.]|jgi:tRNA pseudouridine13 synthase|nr:tRNA pseudouridine(13) synthase TruD [Candidatus Adiutrix sp.]
MADSRALSFAAWPLVSADLPGIGGRIKSRPGHFAVEEIPLYEAAGDGPHLYLTLRRSGLSTREVLEELARRYQTPPSAIGYAGLKDKEAVTTQTFSLPTAMGEAAAREKSLGAPWELTAVGRHRNKLKVGHLLGNRFTIVLREPAGTLAEAGAIAGRLREYGLPNYFGAQRFGRDGDNAAAGLSLLKSGRPGRNWRDKFLLSALQSFIYNHYLALRIKGGLFLTVLDGDICKKYATGGLFQSEEGAVESRRLLAGELTHTGPVFGAKMKEAGGPAAELEARALRELDLTGRDLDRAGAGDRRANRLLIPDLAVGEDPEGLRFSFSLPKGAYATSVMREFIRGAVDIGD